MIHLTNEISHQAKAQVNLSVKELVDAAINRKEGELAANQALVVRTGTRTGRSPKDRFIVLDDLTEHKVNWNVTNQPISAKVFETLWEKASAHLESNDTYFVSYLKVGSLEKYTLPVKVITELAWHNLFAKNLFIHSPEVQPGDSEKQWTILSVPNFKTAAKKDGVNSDAAIILNFSQKRLLICGTHYAGEIKKGMFSVLNFILPDHDILPMHCAANSGSRHDTALFFGLSGTGKTTLSADPKRLLIGDDEHGWGTEGIFNFEGGCYAKCIDLSAEREPIIFNAIRYGTVIENVKLDSNKNPLYSDSSITQNSRAAYPREFIVSRVEDNKGNQPDVVIFLTCDLYGVLPPVSLLSIPQAAYYFLSGYTALVGSTEVNGGNTIQPTFSTCFGAPFFPRPPNEYAELLMKRLTEHPSQVYLVNTGWTGGAHGQGGERFSIPTTRAVVSAIVEGKLKQVQFTTVPGFKLSIPNEVPGVDRDLLNPQKRWKDGNAYKANAKLLISQFIENFKKFKVSDEIRDAGPELLN